MKYAISLLLFSSSLLFSSATVDEKTLDNKMKLQLLKSMSSKGLSVANDANSKNEEQLKRLSSMGRGKLKEQNPYKLLLPGASQKHTSKRPKSKSCIVRSPLILSDDRGAGTLLRRDSDERIESPRMKAGDLKRVASLKRMQELLQREKEKEVFEKKLTREERGLYRALGCADFVYAKKISGLVPLLLQHAKKDVSVCGLAQLYTSYLRERMASLKEPTQLIKVASSTGQKEGSPRGQLTRGALLYIKGASPDVPFSPRDDYSKKDQELLYKILGSADFEFVKKTKGLLPVLLSLVDAQVECSKIWTSYAGYLRLKINKREEMACANYIEDRSPREESPRSVTAIMSEASKQKAYSPRKQGAPLQLDEAEKSTKKRLNLATQQLDGALTGMGLSESSATSALKD